MIITTDSISTTEALRIHEQALSLAKDSATLPTMAGLFRLGVELEPDAHTLELFNKWLEDEYQSLTASVTVNYVPREVLLSEAMAALCSPLLPGETHRFMPVSTLGTAPVDGLMTAEQNLKFRAVHDAMHAKLGVDDSWHGELATTLGHMATCCPQLWPIIASEVAGQAAVAIFEGSFPIQRLSAGCMALFSPMLISCRNSCI